MKWSEFKAVVDELLTIERRRLGVQPFIDRQLRLGVGDVQRLIDYYRTGIVTTLDHDDVIREGFSSKAQLPKGANLREIYHIKTGAIKASRPMYEISTSNKRELVSGVIGIGCGGNYFRYCIDHRDAARDIYFYPALTQGYAIQIVWDAVVGRSSEADYKDDDVVPLDESVAGLVHEFVKMKLAREVDRDIALARDYERTYRTGIASLYSEVQERLRLKRAASEADCAPVPHCDSDILVLDNVIPSGCGVVSPTALTGSCESVSIASPMTEWVMFGDSGEYSVLSDTIEVARAVRSVNPQFVVHMGDAAYGHSGMAGGDPAIVRDLFTKHYWNFIDRNQMYFAWGNHDLESLYGSAFFSAIPQLGTLVGSKRSENKLWYEFARGPVRFFVIHSGSNDGDANIFFDEQKAWLWQRTCAAAEPWLVAVYHRPAYTSDASHAPGSTLMRSLNLHEMGFDLVVNAHAHNYERVLDAYGLMHVICGLGGATKRGKSGITNPTGSQEFFSEKNGFLRFSADESVMQFEMVTAANDVVDRVTIQKLSPRNVDCQGYGYGQGYV
jgi:hypothetical protein